MKLKYFQEPILNSYLEQISILSHIYSKNYNNLKENKTNIHISMAFNNKYLYPILIAMESVLSKANKEKTFVTYHLLCSPDVTEITLSKLKSLMNRYSNNLEIIFYDMGKNFIQRDNKRFSQCTFYRLLLPIICSSDRILYLDADTLVFKDLNEMYQIDFNENYILGMLDYLYYGIDYLGINSEKYINAGVILLNLEKIRNDKIYYNILNITNSNIILKNNDQTVLNYALYPKIGLIPYKYIIFDFHHESDVEPYANNLRTKINTTEISYSIIDPTIIHYIICRPKIWNAKSRYNIKKCKERKDCSCIKSQKLWYYYANKTGYYKEIVKFYRIKNDIQKSFDNLKYL